MVDDRDGTADCSVSTVVLRSSPGALAGGDAYAVGLAPRTWQALVGPQAHDLPGRARAHLARSSASVDAKLGKTTLMMSKHPVTTSCACAETLIRVRALWIPPMTQTAMITPDDRPFAPEDGDAAEQHDGHHVELEAGAGVVAGTGVLERPQDPGPGADQPESV